MRVKPGVYLLEKAAVRFNIDPRSSYSIGDHPHDVEMGKRAGGGGVLVLTGHGGRHLQELTIIPDAVCPSITGRHGP